ncbi:unnamed protein product [Prorocentrum cordatum]|uniref:Uncharacterized protein n=1 Tax=Prorocentrum cordatum TaxID=2364126 RepID=A0ABN9X737_9DINO|nr:unnamed protein product [Polarella glacialis]
MHPISEAAAPRSAREHVHACVVAIDILFAAFDASRRRGAQGRPAARSFAAQAIRARARQGAFRSIITQDIDGHRGARVGAAVLRGLFSAGLALPEPDGRRKKRGRLQRSEGLRAGAICRLADNFVESSAERFQGLDLLENVLVELPEDRWDNIEIVARTANDKPIKRHVDNGTRCHALLIINLGLTSHNMFWPAGGEEVSVMLRSGDAVLFDGKSEHAAPEVMENSSPFPAHPWAGSRRLGVLLRQNIPPGGPRPKRCGAARARLRRAR